MRFHPPAMFLNFPQVLGLVMLMCWQSAVADNATHQVIVGKGETADFSTISGAIASLPMFTYERYEIWVLDGIYEEKIRIENDHITIRGQSRENTIIRYSIPRPEWQQHPDDIGPAVINVFGDDVILENLTIENTQPDTRIHAFAVFGKGTRTILQNCNIWSRGGDTVSLWNYKSGMYYHRNCDFRGAVDFVCPRGWCLVEDSSFYCVRNTAALWHAGGWSIDQKFVLRNCSIDGEESFELGRHHYDAQFYFDGCVFSEKMIDRPIYRVVYEDPTRNRPSNWGSAPFFRDCESSGVEWVVSTPDAFEQWDKRGCEWMFGGRWNPKSTAAPEVVSLKVTDDGLQIEFSEKMTAWDTPILTYGNHHWRYVEGGGSQVIKFRKDTSYGSSSIALELNLVSGELFASVATSEKRYAVF